MRSFAQGRHFAGAIAARDVRIFQLQPRPADAHGHVHAVQRRGSQSDKHLSSLWLRRRKIGILQHFGSAMLRGRESLSYAGSRSLSQDASAWTRGNAGLLNRIAIQSG